MDCRAARKNGHRQFVIDGEAVLLGVDGISDFNGPHAASPTDEVQLYAFDILALDGEESEGSAVVMRKTNLAQLLCGRRQAERPPREPAQSRAKLATPLAPGCWGYRASPISNPPSTPPGQRASSPSELCVDVRPAPKLRSFRGIPHSPAAGIHGASGELRARSSTSRIVP